MAVKFVTLFSADPPCHRRPEVYHRSSRQCAGTLRLLLARIFLALALVTGGVGAAQAACDTSVTFTSAAVGATATLDVSTCTNLAVRSGLYDLADYNSQTDSSVGYPMHAESGTTGPFTETFTLSSGTTQVSITPVAIGYYVDTYNFTIVTAPSGTTSENLSLYYAAGTDSGSNSFGPINTAYPITVNFPSTKTDQTITFTNPGAQSFGTSPQLTATASSNLTVTFSSTTPGVCTVTSGGTLTFIATGTCSVDADQAGDSAYNPAPTVTQSFAVNATAPSAPTIGTATAGDTQASVSFSPPSSNGGATITSYTATSSPGGFTAAGASSPLTVTGLTNGTAYTFTVTATNSVGTGPASAASNSVTPQVSPPVANPVSATVTYNSSSNPITLSISGGTPSSVAVASAAGHGTATASGTTITYTPTAGYHGVDSFTYTATNAGGTSAPATVTITVSGPAITVTPTTLPNGVVGHAYTQSLTASGGTAPYTFSTTPATGALPPGVSLSSSGQLSGTPTATGLYTFTVTGTDSSTPTPASFTSGAITLNVLAPPAVTSLSPSSGPTGGGTSVTISGTGFTGATAVTFGTTPASSYVVASDTSITATTPPGSGTVDVTVTAAATTSATSAADRFSYLSTVATLSNLSLSQGTLTPAFASGTLSYSASVANGVTSVTVTPTVTNAAASVSVNGTAVASGTASGPISLSTGANAISVVVTAQDGTTQKTYTVTANVALPGDTITFGPVPTVMTGSAPFDVTATSASGLPVTLTSNTGAVCSVSGKTVTLLAAGTCTIQGTTAGNATYAPGSATLSITVGARPNPASDPVVTALIEGQNQMAQGFATAQIGNFAAHLETLHGDGPLSDRLSAPFALPQVTRNAGFDETAIPSELAGGDLTAGQPASGRPAVNRAAGRTAPTRGNMFGPNVAVWTGGILNFTRNDTFDIHSNGLSAGVDLRVAPNAVLGLGLGYGFGKTKLDDGSRTKGHATSVILYGSMNPAGNSFIDVLAGHSALRFSSVRLITGSTDVANGARGGSEFFGQISTGLEYRTPRWMISPYAKFTAIAGHLSAFSETAANPADALHYDRQSFGSTEASLGLRGSITRKTNFGSVSSFLRAEYHHQFQRTTLAGISYADLTSGPQYVLNLPGSGQDQVTLGLGMTLHFGDDLQVDLDYRNSFGSANKSQSLSARVSLLF